MSQIPQCMSGRALEHGIALTVDHGGTSSSKMYVGGQANAIVAAGSTTATSDAENIASEFKIPANTLVAGSTIRVRWSTVTSASVSTDTLITRLRFGTSGTASSNAECAISTAVNATNADCSTGDMIIQIRTATTAVAFGTISDSAPLGSNLVAAQFEPSFTVDVTAENRLAVTTEFSTTSANLATTQGFVVDIVNPST